MCNLLRLRTATMVLGIACAGLAAGAENASSKPATGPAAASQPAAPGPKGEVGPAAPLRDSDRELLKDAIAVADFTPAALETAIAAAKGRAKPIVFLPAGTYTLEKEIRLLAPLTLIGDQGRSVIRTAGKGTKLFDVAGGPVRFTRLTLQGADKTYNAENNTRGIDVTGAKGVRIDHCDIAGFSYATTFGSDASGQVDHCVIHHNARDGLGYGVCAVSGAQVLVCDNDFSENRHALASNGTLDWGEVKPGGVRKHLPGFGQTHWEFIRNRVHGDAALRIAQAAVDAHPGMDGTFRIEDNDFTDVRFAIGLMDGSGVISGNRFGGFHGYQPAAIWIFSGTHNGIPIEGAMPHHIDIFDNTFSPAFLDTPAAEKYRIADGRQITIDAAVHAATDKKSDTPRPENPRLRPVEDK